MRQGSQYVPSCHYDSNHQEGEGIILFYGYRLHLGIETQFVLSVGHSIFYFADYTFDEIGILTHLELIIQ